MKLFEIFREISHSFAICHVKMFVYNFNFAEPSHMCKPYEATVCLFDFVPTIMTSPIPDMG